MPSLIIEYRTEGPQRGYGFTSPTVGYDDETLKRIWRAAMPRGNGWAAYIGARSLKCFPLDDRRLALAEVTVTDQQDESGRRGIRRAVVQVMVAEACAAHLRRHLLTYPANTSRQIDRLPTTRQWGTIVGRMMPGFGKKQQQLVLTRAYADDRWQIMEGVIVKLALALQVGIRRYHGVVPFTTLALDPREEMPLVGIPDSRLANLPVENVLHL